MSLRNLSAAGFDMCVLSSETHGKGRSKEYNSLGQYTEGPKTSAIDNTLLGWPELVTPKFFKVTSAKRRCKT